MMSTSSKFLGYTLLLAALLLGCSACKNTDDDPDPEPAAPEFVISGSLSSQGTTFDLGEWIQGPMTYSAVGKGLSLSIAKSNLGMMSFGIQDLEQPAIVGTHTFSGSTAGTLSITIDGQPKGFTINAGTLTIEKSEFYRDNPPSGEIRLLSGTFTISGESGMGETFTATCTFGNGQTIFQ